jgi:hypothetical protein
MQRSPVTLDHVGRWKARALGQGEGGSYKPWIDVRSFSTKGRARLRRASGTAGNVILPLTVTGTATGRLSAYQDEIGNACVISDAQYA